MILFGSKIKCTSIFAGVRLIAIVIFVDTFFDRELTHITFNGDSNERKEKKFYRKSF